MYTGCKMNLLNNEKQTPYDLAAKSPECGRLLTQHSSKSLPLIMVQLWCHHLSLATADDEYGDDEDSD